MEKIYTKTLKEVYNEKQGKGTPTDETKQKGIYALYLDGKLFKIGKATDQREGIFHRVSQYYRISPEGTDFITLDNRDSIKIIYFHVETQEECWFYERKLQVIAYENGEKTPLEKKT